MAISLGVRKHLADKTAAKARRQVRGRKAIAGTAERPRLVVTRSSRHMVAQVIDDAVGHTLASASTLEVSLRSGAGDKSVEGARGRQARRRACEEGWRRQGRVRPGWQQVPGPRGCSR